MTITKDFNGLAIIFREDGYISATSVSKAMKKRLDPFWLNHETKEYIQELSKITGIPVNILVVAKRGRNGGTFLHPKMAVRLARWLSIPFEVWCDMEIDNILRGNIQTTVVVPTKEALEVDSVVACFKARILELERELKGIREGGSRRPHREY